MTSDSEIVGQTFGLLRRWVLVILAFGLIGLVLGIWQARQTPREYSSEQTLLYRFGREYFPVTPGEARRDWGENVMISLDNALFTEMRLLTSRTIFSKTIAAEWPQGMPSGTGANAAPLSPVQAADLLSKKFAVTRVQDATMVTVSAHDPDPARADRLVTEQIQAYVAMRASLFDPVSTGFFDDQINAGLDTLAKLTQQRGQVQAKFGAATTDATAPDAVPTDMAVALQPIDTQIAATNANLTLLMNERAAAALSADYRAKVAPVIEVVDNKPAEGHPVGLSPTAFAVMGALAGLICGCVIAFLSTAIFGLRRETVDLSARFRSGDPSQ